MSTSRMKGLIHYLRRAALRTGAGLTDGQLLEDFVCKRNDASFEALIERHGPMVWSVCRRSLSNYQDAEDAFQATFLVLLRKAGSIFQRDLVGNWLYGVALQTTRNARVLATRRKERQPQILETANVPTYEPTQPNHAQLLLDKELCLLPANYRAVIVLCELEGQTRKEAARQLKVPEGTIAGWLARAKKMLAKRLARRGAAVTAGSLAVLLAQNSAIAQVPRLLMEGTMQAARLLAAGQKATGILLPGAVALSQGVMKVMLVSKCKTVTMALLAPLVCACLTAGALQTTNLIGKEQSTLADKTAALAPQTESHKRTTDGSAKNSITPDATASVIDEPADPILIRERKWRQNKLRNEQFNERILSNDYVRDDVAFDQPIMYPPERQLPKEAAKAAEPPYTIGPPDILFIEARNLVPLAGDVDLAQAERVLQEVGGQHLVRADGTIDLGKYGNVFVDGTTVEVAKAVIEKHLSQFFLAPKISLDIFAYNSKVFYVITDVPAGQKVIRLPCTAKDTVLDAISLVFGLPPVPAKSVWIARRAQNASEAERTLKVDWEGITQRGEARTNYQLMAGDRVYVIGAPNTAESQPSQPNGKSANIIDQQADRDFNKAEFYRRIGKPGSAYYYYEMVRRRYPGTNYAQLSVTRMDEIRHKAEEEQQPLEKAKAKGNPEEERLQRFWQDYYDSMKRYYGALDGMDWAKYYKDHGYSLQGPNRIQFAPVFVSPSMQWMVPNAQLQGPPSGPQSFRWGMFRGALNRLGASMTRPSDSLIDQLGLPKDQGLLLQDILPDSAAAKAGLKNNDILLEFAGKKVPSNPAEFAKVLNTFKSGERVDAVILRKGKQETVQGVQLPAVPGLPALPPLPDGFKPAPGPNGRALDLSDLQKLAHDNSPLLRQAASAVESAKGAALQAGLYQGRDLNTVRDLERVQFGYWRSRSIDVQQKSIEMFKADPSKAIIYLENFLNELRASSFDPNDQAALIHPIEMRINYYKRAAVDLPGKAQASGSPPKDDVLNISQTTDKKALAQVAALSDLKLAELAYRRAKMHLDAKVRSAYFAVLVAQESTHAKLALWNLADEAHQVAGKQPPHGDAGSSKAIQLSVMNEQARASVMRADQAYLLAWNHLAATLGLPSMPPTQLMTPIVEPTMLTYKNEDILAHILKNHTDVLSADENVTRERHNLRLAQLSDASEGAIRQQAAGLMKMSDEPRRVRAALTAKVADALRRYDEKRELLKLYQETIVPAQIESFRAALKRYNLADESAHADVVGAQQKLSQSFGNYLTILGDTWQAIADIENLLQK